jgi:hypothetical protein
MIRNVTFPIGRAAILASFTPTSVPATQAQFGTEKEARVMLDRAVAACPRLRRAATRDL